MLSRIEQAGQQFLCSLAATYGELPKVAFGDTTDLQCQYKLFVTLFCQPSARSKVHHDHVLNTMSNPFGYSYASNPQNAEERSSCWCVELTWSTAWQLVRSLLAVGSQGNMTSNRWYKGLMNWRVICFSCTFRCCSKRDSEAVYLSCLHFTSCGT